MTKYLLLLILIIPCATATFGQKIKFKKGDILVDNEITFKFEKTSGKGEAFAYAMTSLQGDTLLKFSDLDMEFTQLPYESSARVGTAYCKVEAPALGGKEAAIYPISLAYGTRFTYDAKKTEFLTATGLDENKWEDYLKYSGAENFAEEFASVQAANAVRAENSVKSMEKFGKFSSRGKGDVYRREEKILVAATNIGTFRKPTFQEIKDNTYPDLLYIITSEDGKHAIGSIYHKPGSYSYIVRSHIDWKKAEFNSYTMPGQLVEPYQHGLNYLVNFGYL